MTSQPANTRCAVAFQGEVQTGTPILSESDLSSEDGDDHQDSIETSTTPTVHIATHQRRGRIQYTTDTHMTSSNNGSIGSVLDFLVGDTGEARYSSFQPMGELAVKGRPIRLLRRMMGVVTSGSDALDVMDWSSSSSFSLKCDDSSLSKQRQHQQARRRT